jgi:hypothetical protein
VLGDGLGVVVDPDGAPVLVSLADEPVLPGAPIAPLLDPALLPEAACATSTPASCAGAWFGPCAVAIANANNSVVVIECLLRFLSCAELGVPPLTRPGIALGRLSRGA